jgi:hypothetical protein
LNILSTSSSLRSFEVRPSKAVQAEFRQKMKEKLIHNAKLIAQPISECDVRCRRIAPREGYLDAIQANNASTNFSQIQRTTKTGIETLNEHKDFDAIFCATGFDVSLKPAWNIVGRNG